MALNETLNRIWGGLLGRPTTARPLTDTEVVQEAMANMFDRNFTTWGGGYTPYPAKAKTFIEKGYRSNPDLYAVVSQMVTKMNAAPLSLKKTGTGKVKKYRQKYNAKKGMFYTVKDRVALYKALREDDVTDVEDHPIIDLLDKPNPYQTRMEFLETAFLFLKLTGNIYIWKQKRETGDKKPFRLYVLPSHLIEIKTNADGSVKQYNVVISPNEFTDFKADEVIHIKYATVLYGHSGEHLYGQSPLLAALRPLQGSNESIDRMLEIMASGGVFGFLTNRSEQNPLTKEQAKALHNKLKASNRSKDELARLFVTNGTVDFVQVGLKPTDLEIEQNAKSYLATFCRVYGWSYLLMDPESLKGYDNFKTAWRSSISQAIAPDLIRIQEALTEGLCAEWDKSLFLEFDISEFIELREDLKEMAALLAQAWWVTPNEKRFAMYYETLEDDDMDKVYAPLGLTTLEQINESGDFKDTSDYGL